MSWGAVAGAAVGVVGSYMSSQNSGDAASGAAGAQAAMSAQAIAEQQRQFDTLLRLLKPYRKAGEAALGQQQTLLGLNGAENQQVALQNLQNQPYFQGLVKQGEDAILQNASATGGLRGGNTEAALAQFRPQMLANLVAQQYSNLGGISAMGQNSAAFTGSAGMQSANSISNLLQQQGAAQAGGIMANANAQNGFLSSLTGAAGSLIGSSF